MDRKKLTRAVKDGLEAFWASIAAAYPEAKPGDLSPDADIPLQTAATAAVKEWIESNVPPAKITIELEIDGDYAAIRAAVNKVLDDGALQDAICDHATDNDVYLFINSAVVK